MSLFINPSVDDVKISKELGAQMVEIHTGLYANARGKDKVKEFQRVKKSVQAGLDTGLLVNAGHGLNYTNVKKIASLKGLRGL